MKLVVGIVQDEDADDVVRDLSDSGLPVTKIGSTGGFLRSGNATLLMGVDDEQLREIMEIVRTRSGKREEPISTTTHTKASLGGAVVCVLGLEHFFKFWVAMTAGACTIADPGRN